MIVAETCGKINETSGYHMVCQEFFDAVRSGEMIADTVRGGWINQTLPRREMSSQAKWFGVENCGSSFFDHSGIPYLLTEVCIYCGGHLAPVAVSPVTQCDGWEP